MIRNSQCRVSLFRLITLLVISFAFIVVGAIDPLLDRALKLTTDLPAETVQAAKNGDITSLYRIAKSIEELDLEASLSILHQLADQKGHIPSQVALGFVYYNKLNDHEKALEYFTTAGENGPHQAALYNAGRIFAEHHDWVPAVAYIRAAATFQATSDSDSTAKLTETCKEAYEILSQEIAKQELTIKEAADIFLYASLTDYPSEDSESIDWWKTAVNSLLLFNTTFVQTNGQVQDQQALEMIVSYLRKIWEYDTYKLSTLQAYLLLDNINDALGPLAGLDDVYVPAAAGYAEALARNLYCQQQVAVLEDEQACFNGAAASAVSYYRRSNDGEGAQRVLELARQFPGTTWKLIEQTPRVFHPELKAQAWWNIQDFEVSKSLPSFYAEHKTELLRELNAVKSLQEGILRGASGRVEAEVDASTGEVIHEQEDAAGMQRIFTPYIGVRTDDVDTSTKGAGGWAEFGPLFDGRHWNEEKCNTVPTICDVIRLHSSSLCTKSADPAQLQARDVSRLCGADTVVTILRLRPGTHILPHCGTTNRRLIMHWCLEGCEGIEFTVGGVTVTNYGGGNGSPIVFDDSFEHSVKHNGSNDRFVVLAVVAHPEVI